jgi:GTPase
MQLRLLSHLSRRSCNLFARYLSATSSRLPHAVQTAQGPDGRAHRSPLRRSPQAVPREQTGLVLAIVGRPNVGKSTLFNRLARLAAGRDKGHDSAPFVPSVVDSFAGVTRDARTTRAALGDLSFELVDTAGLENAPLATGGRRARAARIAREPDFARKPLIGEAARQSLVSVGALDPDEEYRAMYWGMSAATCEAVKFADAALFMIDASVGVTAVDQDIARWLRGLGPSKSIVLVANKCDVNSARAGVADSLILGFGDPVGISAEHNMGLAELYCAIESLQSAWMTTRHAQPEVPNVTASEALHPVEVPARLDPEWQLPHGDENSDEADGVDVYDMSYDPEFADDEPIKRVIVAILGRPNVGKSTLMNRLLDRGQAIIGPASGVTRDAVLAEWRPKMASAEPLWIVDTAGVRTRPQAGTNRVELESIKSSMRALRISHVAVIVIDATEPFTAQDVRLVQVAITEGRAIVLVINKMDCIQSPQSVTNLREVTKRQVRTALNEISGVEILELSAKEWNEGESQTARLYNAIQSARQRWERRIPTSVLTRFVLRFNAARAIGRSSKGRNRGVTKFMSQKKTRPPVFRLDGSAALSDNYIKSLTNAIREEFGFQGVPIRIKRPLTRFRK